MSVNKNVTVPDGSSAISTHLLAIEPNDAQVREMLDGELNATGACGDVG